MELLSGRLFGFFLVLTRIGAFFASAPVFSWVAIPNRIKVSIAVIMGVFFSSLYICPYNIENTSHLEMGIMMGSEAIYGLAMGYIFMFLFSAAKLAARIIERQMGLAMASVLDPLSGENSQPLGMLIEMIFILLFLISNGHHMLFVTIAKSYESFPLGEIPQIGVLLEGIVVTGSTMLLLGLKLSAPILAAFLLMMVVLAILARISPEANILFLSLPLRVGLGMFMVGVFLPFLVGFIKDFAGWVDKLIPI